MIILYCSDEIKRLTSINIYTNKNKLTKTTQIKPYKSIVGVGCGKLTFVGVGLGPLGSVGVHQGPLGSIGVIVIPQGLSQLFVFVRVGLS